MPLDHPKSLGHHPETLIRINSVVSAPSLQTPHSHPQWVASRWDDCRDNPAPTGRALWPTAAACAAVSALSTGAFSGWCRTVEVLTNLHFRLSRVSLD